MLRLLRNPSPSDAVLWVYIAALLTLLVGMAILDPQLVWSAFAGYR